jgi:hypothetical protein
MNHGKRINQASKSKDKYGKSILHAPTKTFTGNTHTNLGVTKYLNYTVGLSAANSLNMI